MTKITALNTLGTKDNRVVATYAVETEGDITLALTIATYQACQWNKTETRDNMRVNFVMAGGMVRAI